MVSIIKYLIRTIFWLQAFAGPVILAGLIILIAGSEKMIIPSLAGGVATGVILAEYIRRKIGLETFFARIYGPNEMDKKKKTD